MKVQKIISKTSLIIGTVLCFGMLSGCEYTRDMAVSDAEKYITEWFSEGEHSVVIVNSFTEEKSESVAYTYVCRTDDGKYTFTVEPYRTYYEMPFCFTIPLNIVRKANSNFATTIMDSMASEKYFKLMNLSDEALLRIVKEMHEFADDIRSELTAYAANDYHKNAVLYVAQIDYNGNVYEYTYNSMVIKGKQYTDEDLVMLIRETIEGKD